MGTITTRALKWAPRLLGIAVSLLLGILSLDAFDRGTPFVQALPDFLMHLVPAVIVSSVVALAWHREWIGAVLFAVLAAAYGVMAREHLSWIAAISVPLLITGVLFGWSAMHRRAGA